MPYHDAILGDGTLITAEDQHHFHTMGSLAHLVGISLMHPENGVEVAQLCTDIEWTMSHLDVVLPVIHAAKVRRQVADYIRIARSHRRSSHLCDVCTDASLAALEPDFHRSGLNADLLAVLSA